MIDTLIELTSQKSEEAAKALSAALRQQKQSTEKLNLLSQYKNEYAEQLNAQMSQGLNVQSMANFRDFLSGLDLAVQQQHHICGLDAERVKAMQHHWQTLERKKLSYDTLAHRANAVLEAKANKYEQKLMDEMASRSYRMAH